MTDTPTLTPDERRLVASCISEFLGAQRGHRKNVHKLNVLLAAMASCRVDPPGPLGGWPCGTGAFRALGMAPADLDKRWAVVKGNGRCLPEGIVAEFVPTVLWSTVRDVIVRGPSSGQAATERLLRAWAAGFEPAGTPRKRGALSSSSIAGFATAWRSFMNSLDEVRKAEENLVGSTEGRLLDAWKQGDFPRRLDVSSLGAAPANRDRSAPDRRFVRLYLLGLNWEIEQRPGNDRKFRLLRNRALVGLTTGLGLRSDAIARLRVRDLVRLHRFSDGAQGPAVHCYPAKTLHPDLCRTKALDPMLFDWLSDYIAYVGLDDDDPLIVGSTRARDSMTAQTVSNAVAGALKRPENDRRSGNPYFRLIGADWPRRRLSAHVLRHLAEDLGADAGLDWINEHREMLRASGRSGLPIDAQVFADALLDHAMPSMGDRYKGLSSHEGREKWGRIAALGAWDHLIGARGAPQGVDVARLDAAQDQLSRVTKREAALRYSIDEIGRGLEKIRPAKRDVSSLVELVLETQRSSARLMRLYEELSTAKVEAEQARVELATARCTLVPVDDLAPLVNPDAVNADDAAALSEPEEPVLREYAWLDEFAWATGVADSTMRKWAAGHLPFHEGDRRRLFEHDAVERLSARRQRIRLDRVDWRRYPQDVVDRLELIRRTPDPRR